MATYDIKLRITERDDCEPMLSDTAMYALVRGLVEHNAILDVDYCHVTKVEPIKEQCPIGLLTDTPHTYVAGRGRVIAWDVADDPRSGVEVCAKCASQALSGKV